MCLRIQCWICQWARTFNFLKRSENRTQPKYYVGFRKTSDEMAFPVKIV